MYPFSYSQHSTAWVLTSATGSQLRMSSTFFNANHRCKRYRDANVAVWKMVSTNDSKGVDEYAQFAEMLGADVPVQASSVDSSEAKEAQSAETSAEKYAEFSEMLGFERTPSERTESGKKSIAEATTRKVEIDPADYDIFDSLLQRSGGTGRKPMKGSKRYMKTHTTDRSAQGGLSQGSFGKSEEVASPEIVNVDADGDPESVNVDAGGDSASTGSRFLTEEETAQAYAVMMEEFGAGMHGNVAAPVEDEVDVEEPLVKSPQLLKPPTRPDDMPVHKPSAQVSQYFFKETGAVPPAESEPVPMLKPKPIVPGVSEPSAVQKSVVEPPQALAENPLPVPPLAQRPSLAPTGKAQDRAVSTDLVPPVARRLSFSSESMVQDNSASELVTATQPMAKEDGDGNAHGQVAPTINIAPTPLAASLMPPPKRNLVEMEKDVVRAVSRKQRRDGEENLLFEEMDVTLTLQNPKLLKIEE